MKNTIHTPQDIGILIQKNRKAQGLTQTELAATSGVGVRFIVDLEKGKPTCQLGKTLRVLYMLGIHFRTEE
jgi:HTH-type transcriptional regulator / antitoxin HipB